MKVSQIIMEIIPLLSAGLFFALVVLITVTYRPGQVIIKSYERMGNRIKEKRNSFFNYERINNFLLSNGASYHYGKNIEPVRYCIYCTLFAATGLLIFIRVHWVLAIIAAFVAYRLPSWLLVSMNKKDNEKMVAELRTVYNTLTVQVVAGVYVVDALSECYRRLPRGRLRDAFQAMSGELLLQKSFKAVLFDFNRKFNNYFIDALCAILIQSQESGKSVELLNDLSEQIRNMNGRLLGKKKNSLDITETLCIIAVFAIAFAIIIYALVKKLLLAGINL